MRFVVMLSQGGPDLDATTEEAVIRVGHLLRDARQRRGVTQRQLARRAGVDQATISRLERGLSPYSRLAIVARLLVELDICPPGLGRAP